MDVVRVSYTTSQQRPAAVFRENHSEENTPSRARTALAPMAKAGRPVTIPDLVREAGVSRSWICTQPELRDEIDQLRRNGPATPRRPAAGVRASIESLRRRLGLAHQLVAQLRQENGELRAALARAHGERRASAASTIADLAAHDTRH
jgi:Family of unknown function (DUF6262)